MYDNIKKRKIFCYFFSLLFSFIFNMNLAFGTDLESTTTNNPASTETVNSNSGSVVETIVESEANSDKYKTFASSSTINGVKIDIETDKDNYTLEDTAKFTVTLTNNNANSVFVKDIQFGLPEYIEKQIIAALPEKLDKQGTDYGTVTKYIEVKLGFTQWVPVVLNNEQLKIGIKASLETIPEDSKFVVSMVSESSSSENEYHDLLSKFDKKDNVERICFFDFSITGQDTSDVRALNGYAKLYIQIPQGWDESQLEAMFVADGNDENFEEKIEEVDGVKYLTFSTNHFSPYALFDPENIDPEMLESLSKDFMQTGHSDLKTILVLVGVAVVSLVLALVFSNKFRKSVFGVILFLSFCNSCMLIQATGTPVNSGVSDTYTAPLNIKLEIIDSKGSNTNDVNVLPENLIVKSYADNDLWAKKDTITEDESNSDAPEILNVFFVGPSIFDETYENSVKVGNMSIFDTRAQAGLKNQIEHFEQTLNTTLVEKNMSGDRKIKYYAPNYRTVTIPTYKDTTQLTEYIKDAYSDIKDAFDASLTNPPDKVTGTVLVGFGTGAILCDMLATEYKEKELITCCICPGLGKEIQGIRPYCLTANLACIDSEVTTIPSKPIILDANLLSLPEAFDEFDSEEIQEEGLNNFNGKLFDLATGKVLPSSENGYIDNIVTPKKVLDATNPGWEDGGALIFKVTHSENTDLTNMISKTKEYIGDGIYHLFDYQILYEIVVKLLILLELE